MDKKLIFSERQRFTQWWIWVILMGINGLFLFGIFKQVLGGQPFGDHPMSNTGLLIAFALSLLLLLLFLTFRLETQIRANGIYVRFFPFERAFEHFPWDIVEKSFIRKYSPMREYGGWGMRFGAAGTAYNIAGDQGLQLELADGKKLLIGTAQPLELAEALEKIGQLRP